MADRIRRYIAMRMFTAYLALITLLAMPASAAEVTEADFRAETVGSLTKLCSASESTEIGKYAIGFCYGWIEGIEQFYDELVADERFEVQPTICPGREVPREETREILVAWSAANPSLMNIAPLDALIRAGRAKFPCS